MRTVDETRTADKKPTGVFIARDSVVIESPEDEAHRWYTIMGFDADHAVPRASRVAVTPVGDPERVQIMVEGVTRGGHPPGGVAGRFIVLSMDKTDAIAIGKALLALGAAGTGEGTATGTGHEHG